MLTIDRTTVKRESSALIDSTGFIGMSSAGSALRTRDSMGWPLLKLLSRFHDLTRWILYNEYESVTHYGVQKNHWYIDLPRAAGDSTRFRPHVESTVLVECDSDRYI